jgi:bifunctional non-homologous end joining protein LigD
VRLFTRRGYDWTDRYPAIAAAAVKLPAKSFTLDREAVVAGADGVAVVDALHRRGRVIDAILQAFDLLELDGEDLRPLPLGKRKDRLAKLLARVWIGIVGNEHTDENGAEVFLHACKMGLEGIVLKRLSKPYQSGRSGHWPKVKNPNSPAMVRHREGTPRSLYEDCRHVSQSQAGYGPLNRPIGSDPTSGNIKANKSASTASATIQISPKLNSDRRSDDDSSRSGSRDKRSLPDIGTSPRSEDLPLLAARRRNGCDVDHMGRKLNVPDRKS